MAMVRCIAGTTIAICGGTIERGRYTGTIGRHWAGHCDAMDVDCHNVSIWNETTGGLSMVDTKLQLLETIASTKTKPTYIL